MLAQSEETAGFDAFGAGAGDGMSGVTDMFDNMVVGGGDSSVMGNAGGGMGMVGMGMRSIGMGWMWRAPKTSIWTGSPTVQ